MKTLLIIILVFLLLSIAGNVYFFKKEKAYKEQSDSYFAEIEQRIMEHTAWTKLAQARIDSLRSERRISDSTFRVAEKGLRIRVANLKARLGDVREIEPGPLSVSVTDTLGNHWYGSHEDFQQWTADCLTKDTIIVYQDSLIATLDGRIYDQSKSFTAEIEQKDLQLHATNQTSDLWREAAENAEKQTRKEKRRTKFWKVATGIVTLGAVFLLAK